MKGGLWGTVALLLVAGSAPAGEHDVFDCEGNDVAVAWAERGGELAREAAEVTEDMKRGAATLSNRQFDQLFAQLTDIVYLGHLHHAIGVLVSLHTADCERDREIRAMLSRMRAIEDDVHD